MNENALQQPVIRTTIKPGDGDTGVDYTRLHSRDFENHEEMLQSIEGKVELDLPGGKVRVVLSNSAMTEIDEGYKNTPYYKAQEGDYFWIALEGNSEMVERSDCIFISNFPSFPKIGDVYFMSDTEVILEVIEVPIDNKSAKVKITSMANPNLKGIYPSLGVSFGPKSLVRQESLCLTERDKEILVYYVKQDLIKKISEVAFSFVESVENIDLIINYLEELGIWAINSDLKVFLKLESLRACENSESIAERIKHYQAQGITIIPEIARGDLSVACECAVLAKQGAYNEDTRKRAWKLMMEKQFELLQIFARYEIPVIIATHVAGSLTATVRNRGSIETGEYEQIGKDVKYPSMSDPRFLEDFEALMKADKESEMKLSRQERKQLILESLARFFGVEISEYMLAGEAYGASPAIKKELIKLVKEAIGHYDKVAVRWYRRFGKEFTAKLLMSKDFNRY